MPKQDNGSESSTAFEQMVSSTDSGERALAEVDDAPAVVAPTWTEDPTFEANEVGFPRLRLGQGLTPEVAEGSAKMGQWIFTGFEALDTVTVVPIQMARTRAKKEDPKSQDSPVVCTSPDGQQGFGNPGVACRTCPFSQWQPGGANGKNLPPACTLTYRYAVWILEHGTIAEVVFQKTSEIKATTINNLIRSFGLGHFALKLTHTIQKGNNRIWATPEVTLTPITHEMVEASGGLVEMPAPRGRRQEPTVIDLTPAPTAV